MLLAGSRSTRSLASGPLVSPLTSVSSRVELAPSDQYSGRREAPALSSRQAQELRPGEGG